MNTPTPPLYYYQFERCSAYCFIFVTCRLVEAFGSTRRKRQMKQREEGAVVAARNADTERLGLLLGEVAARATAAGETRAEVSSGCRRCDRRCSWCWFELMQLGGLVLLLCEVAARATAAGETRAEVSTGAEGTGVTAGVEVG